MMANAAAMLDEALSNFQGNEADRVRLAARATTPAAVLQALADDPALTVRAAVAMNQVYAPGADRRLLADTDERVRVLLAGKVARLLPGLSGVEHHAAQQHVHRTLLALAGDAAIRVRVAIAEAVMSMPEAPRSVILKLAYDPVIAVSAPIVRLSPLLTDADLLDLLASPSAPELAIEVASRPQLGAEVADRVAAHADGRAVRALLQNPSAAIQEATLDALVGRAGDHPDWHEPLVRRPTLPERAARALSFIVAGHLLELLAQRSDLPSHLAEELRERLATTLEAPASPMQSDTSAKLQELSRTGKLNEKSLLEAGASGDQLLVAAILAAASGVALSVLDRAVALRSGKALTSLAWKAGFTMRAGHMVQSVLGRLSPPETLLEADHGAFPLSADEMEWQIELLVEPGR